MKIRSFPLVYGKNCFHLLQIWIIEQFIFRCKEKSSYHLIDCYWCGNLTAARKHNSILQGMQETSYAWTARKFLLPFYRMSSTSQLTLMCITSTCHFFLSNTNDKWIKNQNLNFILDNVLPSLSSLNI